MGVCLGRCVMGFSANLLMPTCGGARPVPAGMIVENFNTPPDASGFFAQVGLAQAGLSPVGLESYPSPGVIQMNGQQIWAMPYIPARSDFYFEAKFFGPEIPVFTVYRQALLSSKWEVDFGAVTNPLPSVAHVVVGRQSGVNCAWINGQKVSPTFLDAISASSGVIIISTGTVASPYRSYTLDAFRFVVGSYYDPAATTIPVPTGDLTW